MGSLPTGTVALLFTDIEGSTTRWEYQREAMQSALAWHDAILREAIEAHEGHVFKTVGDAFYAVFASPIAAVEAALGAQRALLGEDGGEVGPLHVRMALHTGVPVVRDDDYFGTPLNRVARLLSAGHGGQVLLSAATQELIRDQLPLGIALRDLGEHHLKDLIRPEHVFQLVAPNLPADFPPLRTLEHRPNNLPLQPTPFIGRDRELAVVRERLGQPEVRLLTLTGPGGTGKTRLALQAAADLLDDFSDGVWFVNLAPISDPRLVPSTIATALGVAETAGQPLLDTLKWFLHARHLLLLVDNFEQVLPATPLLAELLAAAPRVKVLVTSRVLLGLYGEHDIVIPPLALPDLKRLPPIERLSQFEAVRLFIERAQAVKSDFVITNENAPAVAEICARLDGLPLAIELAAARVRFLPPLALLQRLSSRLKLLTGGSRDLPARHRTLRNTIDWSYSLLEPGEQGLLPRLAVFVRGCTLESVEAVCNAESDLPINPFEGVSSLVDKHLLQHAQGPEGEPRFVMLETIHEYARERFDASGEAEVIRRCHASYFLQLAETAAPVVAATQDVAWLDRLEAEHDNLRAALAWSLGSTGDVDLGVRLAAALVEFWDWRAHQTEGRRWLAIALAASNTPSHARRAALQGAARLALVQFDLAVAHSHAVEAVGLAQHLGDRRAIAHAMLSLGNIAIEPGDTREATALIEEAMALGRALGDGHIISQGLSVLSEIAAVQGNYERATALLEESLAIQRAAGRRDPWTLLRLGYLALEQGDLGRAQPLFQESLALGQAAADTHAVGRVSTQLGHLALLHGNYDEARALLEASLRMVEEVGDRDAIADVHFFQGIVALQLHEHARAAALFRNSLRICGDIGYKSGALRGLAALVVLAEAEGQLEQAARLGGASEALREASGINIPPIYRAAYAGRLAAARAKLDDATWQAAWAEGRAMPLEQAIAYALEETPSFS